MKLYSIGLLLVLMINNNFSRKKKTEKIPMNSFLKKNINNKINNEISNTQEEKSLNNNESTNSQNENQNTNSVNIELLASEFNEKFIKFHNSIIDYCSNNANIGKKTENVIMQKYSKHGTVVAVQFFNNLNLLNMIVEENDENKNQKELEDHFLLLYQINENGQLLQYNLILNYFSSGKKFSYFPKSLIKDTIVFHKDYKILIPIEGLTIGHLKNNNLYPFLMTYKNNFTNMNEKIQYINILNHIILDPKSPITNNVLENFTKNLINNMNFNDNISTIIKANQLNHSVENIIEDINKEIKNDSSYHNQLPDEYLVFQYLLYVPLENRKSPSDSIDPKILWVYTTLEGHVIYMEVQTTIMSKNYDNKDFIKNFFFKYLIPGKPTSPFFYHLNNIVIKNHDFELRIGVINQHHHFNECKDKFFLLASTRNPINDIITKIRLIKKCCEKKILDLF